MAMGIKFSKIKPHLSIYHLRDLVLSPCLLSNNQILFGTLSLIAFCASVCVGVGGGRAEYFSWSMATLC